MLLQARTVTVIALGRLQTTENGNTYLECRIEGGRMAVWGQANVAWMQSQPLPCEADIFCIPDKQDRTLLWVPERAQLVARKTAVAHRKVS